MKKVSILIVAIASCDGNPFEGNVFGTGQAEWVDPPLGTDNNADTETPQPDASPSPDEDDAGAQPDVVSDPLDLDNDGDGVTARFDCADNDPDVLPGTTEECNGLDDDCDGQTDEGVESQSWCVDADGDGHGDPEKCFHNGCDGASFLVADDTDCNDFNGNAHPEAEEVCDGLDNDCDGASDEGVTLSLYRDADGDGFGNLLITQPGCAPAPGWVEQIHASDCDDADADINPEAEEMCNGLDDDCNNKTDEAEPGQNLCDDGDLFTVDVCDPETAACVHSSTSVSFACDFPPDVSQAAIDDGLLCGSAYFFEPQPGMYAPEIVQELDSALTAPLKDVCLALDVGAILRVNTFLFDPFDPFYFWVGGEFTTVIVEGNAIGGAPGTVTIMPGGLDFIYDIGDFGAVCAP